MDCINNNGFELSAIRDYYLDTVKSQQVILVKFSYGGREIRFLFDDGKNKDHVSPMIEFQGVYFYRVVHSLAENDPDEEILIKYIEFDMKVK